MQLPEHRQWKEEDDHVNENVKGCYAFEYGNQVQTVALNVCIPLLPWWNAGENGSENRYDPPGDNECASSPEATTKDPRVSKDPCVEEQRAQLHQCDRCEVRDVGGKDHHVDLSRTGAAGEDV